MSGHWWQVIGSGKCQGEGISDWGNGEGKDFRWEREGGHYGWTLWAGRKKTIQDMSSHTGTLAGWSFAKAARCRGTLPVIVVSKGGIYQGGRAVNCPCLWLIQTCRICCLLENSFWRLVCNIILFKRQLRKVKSSFVPCCLSNIFLTLFSPE